MPEQSPPSFDDLIKAGQAALQQFLSAWGPQAGVPQTGSKPEFGNESETALTGNDPGKRLAAVQADYYQKHLALWHSFLGGGDGSSQAAPAVMPAKGDRRFSGGEWASSPYFDYIRKSYLLNANYLTEMARSAHFDGRSKDKLEFTTRQFIDAMSPANFAATNPEVLKLALESNGASLSEGIRNLIEDFSKGRLSTTRESEFEIGRNLAITEGQVIFESKLIQLIQYSPTTPQVYKRPLLMVPPCINKYYIMDMTPESSLVRFAVDQGHTVFMVSWRNATPELASLTWDDYLQLGLLDAIDVVSEIARADKINVLGFCVGGTLLGAALAILAAQDDDRVASVTLLAAMLDFSDPGELGIFIDEQGVVAREASIGTSGILSGKDLSVAFSSLRANDMVWSYVVNNYLKGRQPEAFDLLFWNADSTNLAGPMYCYYLRNTYLENNLRVPGKLTMLGKPVDLGKVGAPTYILATRDDHIVPWKTAYLSTQLLGGKSRFVLGASGHIAGVVNPASKNRRSHWINDKLSKDPQAWLDAATEVPGTWWNDWAEWLGKHGGVKIKARKNLGNKLYRPIEAAPGRYVKQPMA
ncbi:MAG: class I poly(R)-hydroxyalkanoic acid synthase [Betaproteobacteria bacterium RIFCSPLOWO2_02_FULL_62_17]|nr:MAG: class I poly(R)-hydroxyalkanoic acid synthase [Betaproteobacteria bacterium RIFCSPLOWO2_02_FULL_62_17]